MTADCRNRRSRSAPGGGSRTGRSRGRTHSSSLFGHRSRTATPMIGREWPVLVVSDSQISSLFHESGVNISKGLLRNDLQFREEAFTASRVPICRAIAAHDPRKFGLRLFARQPSFTDAHFPSHWRRATEMGRGISAPELTSGPMREVVRRGGSSASANRGERHGANFVPHRESARVSCDLRLRFRASEPGTP